MPESENENAPIWLQRSGEPSLWFRRFDRFRLMWPVRKIATIFQEERTEGNRGKPRKTQRTDPTGDWYEIAKQWQWEERAAAWDKHEADELTKRHAAEKARILSSGYALMHKRVEKLNELTEKLLEMTKSENKIWVPDVKAIGSGPMAERVDLVQFNDALFREIRAHLADIAAELGERSKKSEVALTVLPKVYQGTDPDEDGTIE